MPSSAARVAAYRARRKLDGAPDHSHGSRKPSPSRIAPFTGCDGEGAGTDELGRQLYVLFRMGERELWKRGRRLTTWEILDFICDEPPGKILVGFSFGYDVTMILRDLAETQQRRLFQPRSFEAGQSPFVWFKDFDIDYLPKQYLRVRRIRHVRDDEGKLKRVPVKGSTRTIWETFGFFQKSFLKVIKEFGVADSAELELIEASKEKRGDDDWSVGNVERDYCRLECILLARLLNRLRDYCSEAGIFPRSWSGAGKLAAALHTLHKTPKARELEDKIPPEVMALANMAYYGGRFEISRTGMIKQKVYEYDIRSAYPDAMRQLPCLLHGQWEKLDAKQHPDGPLRAPYIASLHFKPNLKSTVLRGRNANFGPLPIRSKEGFLYWPLAGSGVYWSHEIESARRLGFDVHILGGWQYVRNCECKPFDWVEPLFDYRRSIGLSGAGYPIKLGVNSLYGKLAQRKGNGAFNNMVWAGLITAITRARLNDAIALAPDQIVMVATDAVYSLKPLELYLGDWLGSWEQTILDELFIVQPGLYWDASKRKRKSRGLSGRFFEDEGRTESFERAWTDYQASGASGLDAARPAVETPVHSFTGLRLALARNAPQTAGVWATAPRSISFDWGNKRVGCEWGDGHAITKPKLGGPRCVSLPHRDFLASGGQELWENARLMLDEQPDYFDIGAPTWDIDA